VASGTTVLGFRPQDLHNFVLATPPQDLIEHFDAIAMDFSDQAEDLMEAAETLSSMRGLLLPKLVSGAIDVSSLDLEVAGPTA
jgi:type I restriction enzyme S subunit